MGRLVRFWVLAFALAGSALAMGPGDRVLGAWGSGTYEFPGRVAAVEGEQVKVAYDDGTEETIPSGKVRPFDWAEGTVVSCRWQGGKEWYRGTITTITDPDLHVRYDDGDEEDTVTALCRCPAAERSAPEEDPSPERVVGATEP